MLLITVDSVTVRLVSVKNDVEASSYILYVSVVIGSVAIVGEDVPVSFANHTQYLHNWYQTDLHLPSQTYCFRL